MPFRNSETTNRVTWEAEPFDGAAGTCHKDFCIRRPVEIVCEKDAKVAKTSCRCDHEGANGDGCGKGAVEMWGCASVKKEYFSFVQVN